MSSLSFIPSSKYTLHDSPTILYFFLSQQEAHINTCYKHFYYFVIEFNMVDPKELEPLVSNNFCFLNIQKEN